VYLLLVTDSNYGSGITEEFGTIFYLSSAITVEIEEPVIGTHPRGALGGTVVIEIEISATISASRW
jgi:hypothetical protein